jgi:hypothetical protein
MSPLRLMIVALITWALGGLIAFGVLPSFTDVQRTIRAARFASERTAALAPSRPQTSLPSLLRAPASGASAVAVADY